MTVDGKYEFEGCSECGHIWLTHDLYGCNATRCECLAVNPELSKS